MKRVRLPQQHFDLGVEPSWSDAPSPRCQVLKEHDSRHGTGVRIVASGLAGPRQESPRRARPHERLRVEVRTRAWLFERVYGVPARPPNRFTSASIVALLPVTKNARIFCDSGSLVYPSIRATTRVWVLSTGSK